jgi:hypothetical protein
MKDRVAVLLPSDSIECDYLIGREAINLAVIRSLVFGT